MPDRERFPRSARLTRKAEFSHVFKHGRRIAGRRFICYWIRCEGQGCRLGCAVSRKVGKAVARNRVKRQIREFFRTHRRHLKPDAWLVVVARPGCADLTQAECAEDLRALLRRGDAWNG